MSELSIFHGALAIADSQARSTFLDQACGGDAALRQRIEELLEAHFRTAPFMSRVAAEVLGGAEEAAGGKTGAVIAGRFTLHERIGVGGMGEVWVAEQLEPIKRKVAVKLIKAGMDSSAVVARFEAERQALALMDHPNIAKVFDGGLTDRGHPFFVMELVNGLPLARFCDQARLTPRERLALFVPICQAVQHAHQKGIVHRDLKPANVLVTLYDGRPVPKVIDFGVAKAIGCKLTDSTLSTQFGAVLGTLEYMAPEQAGFSALDVDTRADIYSLGVILYEILTGLKPFDTTRLHKAALDEVLRIIREEEPLRPSTRLSTDDALPSLAAVRRMEPKGLTALMRGELDWVVMKCLEKDRSRRYETASALGRDVERFLNDEIVEARPPSTAYRLRKFARKNRTALWTAAAITALLVMGIVGTTWGMLQARASESQARKRLTQLEKSNEIITSIFTDLDIEEVRNGTEPLEAVLAQRLVKAANQLDGEAIGDPLVVAALQHRLAETLMSLGYPQDAIPLFAKALETRKARGIDHDDTLSSMNGLAESYRVAGELQRAEELHREILKLTEVKFGASHPGTLESMNNLALTFQAQGRPQLAVPLFQKVLAHVENSPEANRKNTLRVMNNLALAQQATGDLKSAIPLHEKTLKLRTAELGPDNPDTISSMNNLGEALTSAKQLGQAVLLLDKAFDRAKEKLGMRHVNTLTTMNALALAYLDDGKLNRDVGKLNRALKLFEQSLEATKERLSPTNINTLRAMNNLGLCHQAMERPDKAVTVFEEAWDIAKATLPPDNPRRLRISSNLAQAYRAHGKPEKAIQQLEETIRLTKTDDPEMLRVRHFLALTYEAAGEPESALPHFREAAEGMEKTEFRHPAAGEVVSNYVGLLERLGQFPEAEKWRQKVLPAAKELGGPIVYAGELAAVGRNRLAQQKWTDAEPVLREALDVRERVKRDDWFTSNTRSMLGAALLGQKKYAEAEPLLLEGYLGMKRRDIERPPDGRPKMADAADRLVELYVALGKPVEAAKWRAERATYPEPAPPPRLLRP